MHDADTYGDDNKGQFIIRIDPHIVKIQFLFSSFEYHQLSIFLLAILLSIDFYLHSDAINKIGFGLVVYSIATSSSKEA